MKTTIILFFICALPIFMFVVCFRQSVRLERFRNNLKEGDGCIIFIGENRIQAVVKIRFKTCVWVETLVEKEYLRRNIDEIYC